MKRHFVLACAVLAAPLLPSTALAEGYPASYFNLVGMRVPVSSCVNAAKKAAEAVGLQGITNSDVATGGYTSTTRGYAVCVRLPNAGDCGGDGATAVVITAGADAKSLLKSLTDKLVVPVLIDCGSEGHPAGE